MKFSFSHLLVFSFSRFLVLLVTATLFIAQTSAQVVNIPDPNLEKVIREALQLPDDRPLTQQEMLRLTKLDAGGNRGIADLTRLEYATNLRALDLYQNPIVDIGPLAHLTKLWGFNFWGCQVRDLNPLRNLKSLRGIILSNNQISDISPLSELTDLTHLVLDGNYIVDYSPLANLTNLEKLWINRNLGTDFTPLQGLNIPDLRYDAVCDIEPPLPLVKERIETRSFPSVFQIWGGIGWTPVINRPDLSDEEHITLHDLYWSPGFQAIRWDVTLTEPTYGVATQLAGSLEYAREVRQRWLDQNPNMVFLLSMLIHEHGSIDAFPPNSDFWLRDANGEIIRKWTGSPLINFLKPEVQDLFIKRIIAIERCGLYDGVMLDGFANNGTGFSGRVLYSATDEEIIQAWLNIFRAVRAEVREDFLIIVNGGDKKLTSYTEFINGTFMETGIDYPGGYTRGSLHNLEEVLSWSEENLRSPQINCLEGASMDIEPLDGPNNLRWMRLFTTLSLTHSDGYVIYAAGIRGAYHHHLWHDFWDADLGQPVGRKAQPYENVDGLFIREFTNGWAVYNRSGKVQEISLPQPVTGVSSSKHGIPHLLLDLDGEIYLKTPNPADVNGDGRVNVLDLVQITNSFGKSVPDPNGDGIVNILDLVFVANTFSR